MSFDYYELRWIVFIDDAIENQRRPSGLVTRSATPSIVTVEIFVKQEQIFPFFVSGIFLLIPCQLMNHFDWLFDQKSIDFSFILTVTRTFSRWICSENVAQLLRNERGDFFQIHFDVGSGRTFHLEIIAVIRIISVFPHNWKIKLFSAFIEIEFQIITLKVTG